MREKRLAKLLAENKELFVTIKSILNGCHLYIDPFMWMVDLTGGLFAGH
jgi:hypothetical protein